MPPGTWRARIALLGLLLVAGWGVRGTGSIAPPPRDPSAIGDTKLQLETIERLRAGEPYYEAVGGSLRRYGYPTSPIVNWRTPLHYTLVAALSVERAGSLLFLLALAVAVTGTIVYRQHSFGRAVAAGIVLLVTMAPAMLMRPTAVVYPEMWAGVLIGLSLNAYLARQWVLAAACGLLAVFFRELAVPYAVVCGLIGLRARRFPESAVWICGAIAYAIYYALHAAAASAAIQPGDLVREGSYFQVSGLPFIYKTLYLHAAFSLLPAFLTPAGAALGLAAAWARSAPGQLRLSLLVYFGAFCLVGQPFNSYWGYLTAPIWGHGFVYSVEGFGRLLAAARVRFRSTSHPVRAQGAAR